MMHFAQEGASALPRVSQQSDAHVARLFFWLYCGHRLGV